jgi:hypothetical protein
MKLNHQEKRYCCHVSRKLRNRYTIAILVQGTSISNLDPQRSRSYRKKVPSISECSQNRIRRDCSTSSSILHRYCSNCIGLFLRRKAKAKERCKRLGRVEGALRRYRWRGGPRLRAIRRRLSIWRRCMIGEDISYQQGGVENEICFNRMLGLEFMIYIIVWLKYLFNE